MMKHKNVLPRKSNYKTHIGREESTIISMILYIELYSINSVFKEHLRYVLNC